MTEYTIFIFRRDLRLFDNIGLYSAIKKYDKIIPIFIFTPEQVTDKNKFKSENAIQFMVESLKDLDNNLKEYNSKLHIFYGDNIQVLQSIIKKISIRAIVFNMDYTKYAIKRDNSIKKLCKDNNIECVIKEDYLLQPISTLNKDNGDPYTVFTPFKNNGLKFPVDKPNKYKIKNLSRTNKLKTVDYIEYKENNDAIVRGGRILALLMLKKIKNQDEYNETRNTVSLETTRLSAYIKFGCVSIREVFWKFKKILGLENDLIGQLYWREFYYYIVYYFPKVLNGENYNKKYDKIKWTSSKSNFIKWTNGETGYPIVDAGMRELNKTGYMHNRARLITSNFLNRMLGMDWRLGEKYYATKLLDYDPAVNNGNWQWIASTGVDPKPYFQRLFNPWLQSKKYDPDAEYIKKWIPELEHVSAKEIHEWDKYCDNHDIKKIGYFKPIVEYKKAREKSIKMYKNK